LEVPLLDLKPQYHSLKNEIDTAIQRVVESQYFILGPEVESMEKLMCSYLRCKHGVGVSSGTDALLVALMAVDLRPGDEVIVPTYSFFATAGVVARLNAVPVFVDIDPVTFNIDPSQIQKKITKKTKAIIPVHLFGQSAAMDEILSIAQEYGLKVIEDAAQAIGTQYKDGRSAGTIGDIGCFSFFPSKNLGCFGDGGLVTTNDNALAEKLRTLRMHGSKVKYYHTMVGGNFRIDALQAAIVNVKLPFLDGWSQQRRENAGLYTNLFVEAGAAKEEGGTSFDNNNTVLLPKAVYKETGHTNYHIYNQYVIRTKRRNELRRFLSEKKIGNEVYYPVPFHQQECFAGLNNRNEEYPVSNAAAADSLALPIYPELRHEQIEFVVQSIVDFQRTAPAAFPAK
jgi:dTDP-4-amino-4,6-dideoxygalactose transaminase